MRGNDRKLCFSEKERGKVWKDYIERILNEENEWDGRRCSRRSSSPVSREEAL